jgi:RNA polymerase sigma-70 factor (ECF subfamily)
VTEAKTSASLVSAAAGGDSAAFENVYREHAPALRGFVGKTLDNPGEAEDLCQEIWLKAYRMLDTLRCPEAFSSWLYRMALRACVSQQRKEGRRSSIAPFVAADPMAAEEADAEATQWGSKRSDLDPLGSLVRDEEASLVWEALAALPERQHVALYLREVERFAHDEIAQAMGLSLSAVEHLLTRARRSLTAGHQTLLTDPRVGCRLAGACAAAVDGGRATVVQEIALRRHLARCRPCRQSLAPQRNVSALFGIPVGWLTGPHADWRDSAL